MKPRWSVLQHLAIASLFIANVVSCQSVPKLTPPPQQKEVVWNKPARLAVAFGGGGAKGYAHLGVIKAFEEAGLYPDVISGTSIGSLVGAWWASGLSFREMSAAADVMMNEDPFDVTLFSRGGWVAGDKFEEGIRRSLSGKTFEDLKIPLIAIATNLRSGKSTEFTQGDLAQAIRASCSLPGIFLPKVIEGESYVDGDAVSPLATEPALRSQAQVIVAVDISNDLAPWQGRSGDEIQQRSNEILRKTLIAKQKQNIQFVIHPSSVFQWNYSKDQDPQALVQNAYEETKLLIPQIKAALSL